MFQASKLDNGNILALQGMIQCQIIEGHYEDAEAQMELFSVLHGSGSSNSSKSSSPSISAEFAYYQVKKKKNLELFLKKYLLNPTTYNISVK